MYKIVHVLIKLMIFVIKWNHGRGSYIIFVVKWVSEHNARPAYLLLSTVPYLQTDNSTWSIMKQIIWYWLHGSTSSRHLFFILTNGEPTLASLKVICDVVSLQFYGQFTWWIWIAHWLMFPIFQAIQQADFSCLGVMLWYD